MSKRKERFTPGTWTFDQFGAVWGNDGKDMVCDVYTTDDEPKELDINLIVTEHEIGAILAKARGEAGNA